MNDNSESQLPDISPEMSIERFLKITWLQHDLEAFFALTQQCLNDSSGCAIRWNDLLKKHIEDRGVTYEQIDNPQSPEQALLSQKLSAVMDGIFDEMGLLFSSAQPRNFVIGEKAAQMLPKSQANLIGALTTFTGDETESREIAAILRAHFKEEIKLKLDTFQKRQTG